MPNPADHVAEIYLRGLAGEVPSVPVSSDALEQLNRPSELGALPGLDCRVNGPGKPFLARRGECLPELPSRRGRAHRGGGDGDRLVQVVGGAVVQEDVHEAGDDGRDARMLGDRLAHGGVVGRGRAAAVLLGQGDDDADHHRGGGQSGGDQPGSRCWVPGCR